MEQNDRINANQIDFDDKKKYRLNDVTEITASWRSTIPAFYTSPVQLYAAVADSAPGFSSTAGAAEKIRRRFWLS